jgi:pimeloyl-ACP methyl ester carboxylesterase
MKKIALYIILVISIFNSYAIKPDTITKYPYTPNHQGLQYRQITFYTSDSLRLEGWLIPAQKYNELCYNEDMQRISCFIDNPVENEYDMNIYSAKPTIIITGSDAGHMWYNTWDANYFMKYGDFNIFLFDWRGFGESQSWEINPKTLWLPEFRLDLEAAIEAVSKLPEVDSTKICAYGTSFGFADIFATAVKNHKLKCIAGQHLMTNLVDFQKCLSIVDDDAYQLIIPSAFENGLFPIDCADKLECPVYCAVREFEVITPVWMAESIFSKVKSTKKLNILKGAGEICGFDENNLIVIEEVCNFFKENLNK